MLSFKPFITRRIQSGTQQYSTNLGKYTDGSATLVLKEPNTRYTAEKALKPRNQYWNKHGVRSRLPSHSYPADRNDALDSPQESWSTSRANYPTAADGFLYALRKISVVQFV